MAVIDLVKLDAYSDDFIVQKFLSEHEWELRLGSQLVVNPSQEAIFVKGGVALDVFGSGTHTLTIGNIPLLRKLVNSIFGDKTPFTSEVWFINKTVKRDLKWGTPKRIPVMDPKFGFPVNIGAFGQWGYRIEDSRSFVTQIVGAQLYADSSKIYNYFIGEITEKVTQSISSLVVQGTSIIDINSKLKDLSSIVINDITDEFNRFGIELVNFTISNISIAPEEMQKIQEVMAKRMEVEQLSSVNVGQSYLAVKNLEIMKDAANNTGAAGTMLGGALGAGLAFGVGLPMGQQIASEVMKSPENQNSNQSGNINIDNTAERLTKLNKLLEAGLITKEEYETKRAAILDNI